jgi:hypothetical protein
MEFRPEMMESAGYREALAAMLAQFLHGEEISFTAVPLGLEFVRGEELCRAVEQQLEDEKRHHAMFDAERARLGLPRDEPNEAMYRFYDVVIDRMKRREIIGGVISGCFMLEGAAFSTLLTHSNVVDPTLSEVFKEIYADEARHIALNISVVQDIIAQRPENVNEVVEAHREALPLLFQLFTSFKTINDEMGVDNEWFTMRCLFHHSQRIRRLHLPNEIAKVMLADTVAVAQSSK